MSGNSFDDRGHGDSREQEGGSNGSFEALRGPHAERNCFVISRSLHQDLLGCLNALKSVSIKSSEFVAKELMSLDTGQHSYDENFVFDAQSSWMKRQVVRGARDLADILSAVDTLETILFSPDTVGSPLFREIGQRPIQHLVLILKHLADTSNVNDAGSRTMGPVGEPIDGSLRGLFAKHGEELKRLAEIPK